MNDTNSRDYPILENYHHKRHFLQTLSLPSFDPPAMSFLYVKNHKCACTTILATLLTHLQAEAGTRFELDLDAAHAPPRELLRTGPRGLTMEMAMGAITDASLFRFTIVREPTARTVSAYADKILSAQKQKTKLMQYLGRPPKSEIPLSEFLDILAQDEGARDLDRHWRPQRKEISFDYIPFDFIGDTADVADAMRRITETIFGTPRAMVDTRKSFAHESPSRELVRDLSGIDRKNIETAYAADFDMYEKVRRRASESV